MKAQDETPINMRAVGITMILAALLTTLLVMTLTAGQADATTTNIAPSGDDNSIPQPQSGRDATPEACPAQGQAARVVNSGQYALFDVYWNPVEEELTNTVCPPSITYVPAKTGRGGHPARTDRTASSINITAEPPTIIHIPSSAKINLSDRTTYGNKTYGQMYPQVVTADNLEDRANSTGTPVPNMGDGVVWALPACPPAGSPSANDLCLSFSAALLDPGDWLGSEPRADATIDYLVHHVHQVDIDKQDPRYVLVYDVPASSAPRANEPLWNSHDARKSKVSVAPGGYNRPLWFFTDRGTYEFQVNIKGYPNTTKANPESKDPGVTSDVREYIVHVGAEADLSATVEVTPQNPSPSSAGNVSDVVVTITARNNNAAGQDVAQETKVDVTLPDGLTYSSHVPAADSFTKSEGGWTWNAGRMNPATSKTLTITAAVDAETHGRELDVEATIYATEPVKITETVKNAQGQEEEVVKTYHVPVPDPTPANNTDSDTITVASQANVAPNFVVVRSVAENSQGVNLGDPVPVLPGDDDTLFYSLAGVGSDKFEATGVTGGVQLSVADEAVLNYEDASSYTLILGVSDRKDDNGNANDVIDGKIAVRINITDVANEQMIVTLSADRATQTLGQPVIMTAKVSNSPVATSQLIYGMDEYNEDIPNHDEYETEVYSLTYTAGYTRFPVSRTYVFSVGFDPPGPEHWDTVESNYLRVNWNR
ncbi:MAG: hypothetical protein F4Y63_02620 [Chloroflexi bacterium]|nr:hypothetical protein [Chloroflexota bacterium]MYK61778.1 hypothetical protein [Chloroflexota bacterium]